MLNAIIGNRPHYIKISYIVEINQKLQGWSPCADQRPLLATLLCPQQQCPRALSLPLSYDPNFAAVPHCTQS